jgi:hypothetical protein
MWKTLNPPVMIMKMMMESDLGAGLLMMVPIFEVGRSKLKGGPGR